MYTLEIKSEMASSVYRNDWELEGSPKTYQGRWTITYRVVGETSQKVYEIHRPAFGIYRAHSDYLPEDLEYIWIHSLDASERIEYTSWEECENFDTRNALKVNPPSKAKLYVNDSKFPDPYFRTFLLRKFDTNRDGIISDEEALNVKEIGVRNMHLTSLEGIQYFPNITRLDCSENQLTSLDVSQNSALIGLWCYSNQLTSLDVSGCTALTRLDCQTNRLTSLDVSGCSALTYLE